MDSEWFDQKQMDTLRHNVLLIMMPVYFLGAGLRTDWSVGGAAVFIAAGVLLFAAVVGKLLATHIAGKILGWAPVEAAIIGWLLQTKALIMIIFTVPYLIWRLGRTDCYAPLVLVQIFTGSCLDPAF